MVEGAASYAGALLDFSPEVADRWATAESVTGRELRAFGVRLGVLVDVLNPSSTIRPVQVGTGEGAQRGYSFPDGRLHGSSSVHPVVGLGSAAAALQGVTPDTERGRYVLALVHLQRELNALALRTPATRTSGAYLWRSAGVLIPGAVAAVLVVALVLGVLYVEEQAVVSENIAVRQTQARVAAASADYQRRVETIAAGNPDPGPSENERAASAEITARAAAQHEANRTSVPRAASDAIKTVGYAVAAAIAWKILGG